MTLIRRKNFLELMDDILSDWSENTSCTCYGQLVDPRKYEIRPKKEYLEILITQKQEQIDALIRQHESEERYFQQRLERLKEEKEKLLKDRDNK